MSGQDIEIAAPQRVAIHDPRVSEVAMTSPYLDHIRSTRKIIEDLITAREVELAKTTTANQRRRVERELSFLRDELARIDSESCIEWRR
ncbi:MAG TPA: hypothetical protein VEK82_05875 [Stellaceae bacterium]|nr:hypothetical protein [Stellaceae bacterium]